MDLWNLYAKIYEFLRSNPVSKVILQAEERSIKKLLTLRTTASNTGQALDLGTGRGNCIKCIPSEIKKIFALDKSSEMVALTAKKYKHVEVILGDVCQTPFTNESMDLILCVGVSEYVENLNDLLAEIKRLLSSSGYVVFTSSPPKLLNQFRRSIGHTIYLRTQDEILESCTNNDLKLLSSAHTVIQNQYLLGFRCQGTLENAPEAPHLRFKKYCPKVGVHFSTPASLV